MKPIKNQSMGAVKDHLTFSIEMNRWFLTAIGAWPKSLCYRKREKICMYLIRGISCSLVAFLVLPALLAMILNDDDNINNKIRIIGPLSFCLMAATTIIILLFRGDDITRCVGRMIEDRENIDENFLVEEDDIIIENAKFGRSMAIFCTCFMYGGGIFYTTIMPLITKRTEIIGNATVRSVSFPIYRGLLDPRDSPYFEIVQSMQCLGGYVIYSVTIGSCSLAAIFVTHACGQLKLVVFRLGYLIDGYSKDPDVTSKYQTDTIEKRIADIVKSHLRILSFISWIERLLNEICFVEFIGCTLNICLLGYYVMMEWQDSDIVGILTYFALLVSFTFNIFILCYIGELLTKEGSIEMYQQLMESDLKCTDVGLASYMIEWYRLPKKKAIFLVMMIAASETPTSLTAGKFVELSLTTFFNVIKSSMAYLNLLRTLV